MGLVHPDRVRRNAGCALAACWCWASHWSVGVYSAALKKEQLGDAHYREMIANTTRLNTLARCWRRSRVCTPLPM